MDFDVIKAILSKTGDLLRRHLVLSTSVIDKLRQMDVIGKFTKDQMMSNRTDIQKQLTLLFVCLRTRGLPALQGFLNVLRMTFHGWLADEILDSVINIGGLSTHLGQNLSVRDILNQMYESKLQTDHLKYKPVFLADSEYPYYPQFPKGQHYRTEADDRQMFPVRARMRRTQSEHQSRRHEYTSAESNGNTRITRTAEDVPLIEQVPENLRDLQKAFDMEASSTQKSIAILRQEEITIKALLQHNLREQQELLTRQQALQEIKDKMKELNNTATQLYGPEPDASISRKRLKHLQQISWTGKD